MARLGDTRVARVELFGSETKGESIGCALLDKSGNRVVQLTHSDKITNMSLFDKERRVRTVLGRLPGKGPGFQLYDRSLFPLVEMTEGLDGQPKINVNDPVARDSRTYK